MAELDIKKAEELEEKYDSGLQTRVIGPYLVKFTFYFSILFAAYHYVTAGIGVPIDYWAYGLAHGWSHDFSVYWISSFPKQTC